MLNFVYNGKITKDFANMQENEQKVSPIKQRILYFANTLGVSKREFYKKIGVSRGTLESNTGITEETLAKFIDVFPNISVDWLLTGKGEMERQPSSEATDPLHELLLSQQRTIENLSETILNLTSK